ncbi:MAG: EVE domain-containing protein [Candidatus Margulisbacteria bacterium]|nr:EVE domain-containing protein [Candidatus Margulisiibacteriota bacterium]
MKSKKWLMKTEPSTYSIDRLMAEKTTHWEGIRNYQARNFMMRDMRIGDDVIIYHSNASPPGIVGLAVIASDAYPDHFSWDDASPYYDPKSTKENPRWFMVDVAFRSKFKNMIPLEVLKSDPNLNDMLLVKKGTRLSIQPVQEDIFDYIIRTYQS